MADAELSALLEQRAQLKIAETVGRKNGRAAAWYEERPAEQRFVGLLNQGATCYLNSLVQALFMLPAVREKVFSFEFDADRHGAAETCVPLQLGVLFARLATSSLHALDTRALTASFGWSQAEAFRQHDVQELLAVLFDALEKYQCDVSSAFSGEMRPSVRCQSCGYESARAEAFRDVQLDIGESGSVEDAMRRYVAWERMEGEGTWKCEQCGARNSAKGCAFTKLPPILTLHLKRFVFDMQTLRRKKLNHRVTFPATLDAATLFRPPPLEADGGDGDDAGGDSDVYECVGVLVHSDRPRGHYFALLRTGEEAAAACGRRTPSRRRSRRRQPPRRRTAMRRRSGGRRRAGSADARRPGGGQLDVVVGGGLAAAGWHEFNDATVKRASVGSISAAEGRGPVGRSGDSGANTRCSTNGWRRPPSAPPPPVPALLALAAAEEAEAAQLRGWREAATRPPADLGRRLPSRRRGDAHSTRRRARRRPQQPRQAPLGAPAIDGGAVRRLRRWRRWHFAEQPLTEADLAEARCVRSSAPRAALVVEWRRTSRGRRRARVRRRRPADARRAARRPRPRVRGAASAAAARPSRWLVVRAARL